MVFIYLCAFMKRVLIISYYWPPTGGSGVQRWVKFAKYLPSEGWQPVIYTPENPEQLAVDESLGAEVPEAAEIVKTRILEPYEMYKKLLRKSGHSKEAGDVGARQPFPSGSSLSVDRTVSEIPQELS